MNAEPAAVDFVMPVYNEGENIGRALAESSPTSPCPSASWSSMTSTKIIPSRPSGP